MTSRAALLAYAMSFASFLVDSTIGKHLNKILLFGSVARGDFTDESDIDLFIDIDEKYEKDVEKQLLLFEQSQMYKLWQMKGIVHHFSLKLGILDQWKLKREIISSGILLYGKYNALPDSAHYLLLVKINIGKRHVAEQMQIWRKLYGYTQKVGKKIYNSAGLIEKSGGRKLANTLFLVPMEKRQNILQFLRENKIQHTVYEIWSDDL